MTPPTDGYLSDKLMIQSSDKSVFQMKEQEVSPQSHHSSPEVSELLPPCWGSARLAQ